MALLNVHVPLGEPSAPPVETPAEATPKPKRQRKPKVDQVDASGSE